MDAIVKTLPMVIIFAFLMALVVVISNILVQYPINDWLTWGAITFPAAFLVTDITNRLLGVKRASAIMLVGFLAGVLMSFIFATPRIALASGTAFLLAQGLDILIFDKLRRHTWFVPPAVSSLFASAVDTALFFSIAFAMTGLPWITWGLGDFAAKITMMLVFLAPYRWVTLRFAS